MDSQSLLCARRDITWQEDGRGWLAYDPLTRQSYQCGHAQRWLFDHLDGRHTLADIHRDWTLRGDHTATSWQELLNLAQALLERGLVRLVGATDGLAIPAARLPHRSWLQWFSQSVTWRMRGINPASWLKRLAPHTDCVFSATAVQFWLICSVVVALLVIADFERLLRLATVWQWMIRPASGSTLFGIFLITRALHELGHAILLTRFGGRCPDIGLIFMLGAPCVYCDVSDSWRLPTRWQRAAVAAGGMYAELIIATCAATVWLCTAPGLVNTLALQTMFVCSVSTWLVNANPLMRFDGYYILSDWLGETNLRGRSDECLRRAVHRLVLNDQPSQASGLSPWSQLWLCLFSLSGMLYRISLSWMMASLIVALYSAWHFAQLGRWIALALLVCWWGIPTMRLIDQLWQAARSAWARVRLACVAAAIVWLVGAVPMPYRLHSEGWVQPERIQALVAPATVRLISIHRSVGAEIEAGELVFQMDDRAEQLQCLELESQTLRAQLQCASLRKRIYFQDELATDLNALEVNARRAGQQLEIARQTQQQLAVHATRAGRLVSMPAPPLVDVNQRRIIAAPALWLEPAQAGRVVPAGTMLGAICSHEQLAVIPLADEHLADIVVGTPVRVLVPSRRDQLWQGQVESIVQLHQLDVTGRLLTQSEPETATTLSAPNQRLQHAAYAAIVRVPSAPSSTQPPNGLYVNATIKATFVASSRTLASQVMIWGRRNLRWLIQ